MPGHVLSPENCRFSRGDLDPDLINTCFLGPTRILDPNSISISSAIFTQPTAEHLYTLQWAALSPQNCSFSWGDLDHHIIHDSLDPSQPTTHMASRLVQPFLHSSQQNVPTMGRPFPPKKLLLPTGICIPI